MPKARAFRPSKDLDAEFIFPKKRVTKIGEPKGDPPDGNEALNEVFGLSLRLKGIHTDNIRSNEDYFAFLSGPENRSHLWEKVDTSGFIQFFHWRNLADM
jgi:hypothetical protein